MFIIITVVSFQSLPRFEVLICRCNRPIQFWLCCYTMEFLFCNNREFDRTVRTACANFCRVLHHRNLACCKPSVWKERQEERKIQKIFALTNLRVMETSYQWTRHSVSRSYLLLINSHKQRPTSCDHQILNPSCYVCRMVNQKRIYGAN